MSFAEFSVFANALIYHVEHLNAIHYLYPVKIISGQRNAT
eukprot:COSAG06_NODE_56508_length_284_cov_0.951351_2_plen_39_part_01